MRVPPSDLHEFISLIEESGQLSRVSVEVDPHLELATIADQVAQMANGGTALLFERVRGAGMKVVANLFADRQRISLAIGIEKFDSLVDRFAHDLEMTGACKSRQALEGLLGAKAWQPILVEQPLWQQSLGDLTALPQIKAWPEDGGAFLTLAQVYTRHPDSVSLNCGMYRVQCHGPKTATVRFRPGSDGASHLAAWHGRSQEMPVTIALGGPPVLSWVAGLPLPEGISEIAFAGYLCRHAQTMSTCRHSDLLAPASAEVVIEGNIAPGKVCQEGPFGNHTGCYDAEDKAPVMQVKGVYARCRALFPWTLVGPPPKENIALAKATAALLFPLVKLAVPGVRQLHMPAEGIFHRVAFVTLDGTDDLHKEELARSLWATELLKGSRLLVLCRDDHEADDPATIFWRVLNRVDWSRDLWSEEGRLVVDARHQSGKSVEADPAMLAKVLACWSNYRIRDCR